MNPLPLNSPATGRLSRRTVIKVAAVGLVGGAIGLGLAWLITQGGDPTNGMLPAFFLPPADLVRGALIALALGIVAGIMPALQAMRLRIVDALRRT